MPDFSVLFNEAKEFDFRGLDMSLKDFVDYDFNEEVGACLKTTDAFGRRILFIVGAGHNLVVYDRYPDLQVSSFKYYAIPSISLHLPPVLYNKDFDELHAFAFVPRYKNGPSI